MLFRGNGEADIRKNIIKRGYIKAIVGLPANLFYGTGIPACIIIIDKEDAEERNGIFMIDASHGFTKDGNKNRLRERDIRKIVDVFKDQIEVSKYSRFVPNEEIRSHDYNLNIPRYIDSQEIEDPQDLDAHLQGGIPDTDIDFLGEYWAVCPSLRSQLFKDSNRRGYSELKVPIEKVRKIILKHSEFEGFRAHVVDTFVSWRRRMVKMLNNTSKKDRPKAIIQDIASALLDSYTDIYLVDKYDIYQLLMSYWSKTMQDDAHIITVDGWEAGKQVVRLKKGSNGKRKDVPGLEGLEGRLIPVSLIIGIYFTVEQKILDDLYGELEAIAVQKEELIDEHGDEEEGLLAEVIDNDKIKKTDLTKRIKEIKNDPDYVDELKILNVYMNLFDRESEVKAEIKTSLSELERKVIEKYSALSIDDVKKLVVENKWMDSLQAGVREVVDDVSQNLTGRIKLLAERYEEPLPIIAKDVKKITTKVESHIKKMGFVW